MKSIIQKTETLRRAVARCELSAEPLTLKALVENNLPKKDALVIARAAAVMAAKKTYELIPYCHPIPIDFVEITFEVSEKKVVITAIVEAIWKTGVEMEALTAASVAALTLYDMLKPIDKK